ncbi:MULTISPECIES: helix-turn-helix domain-containing protein [Nostocales]|uniref:HTH cro/C1-type domain-containing protein n=2 Tax=Tolypothrix TaxID=111782 RepID=A0A0C1R222_9CYAN
MIEKKPLKQPDYRQLICELRGLTGLTQEEFAAEVGVTYTTVNRWENGHSKPSKLAVGRITQMLQQMDEPGQGLLKKYSLVGKS